MKAQGGTKAFTHRSGGISKFITAVFASQELNQTNRHPYRALDEAASDNNPDREIHGGAMTEVYHPI